MSIFDILGKEAAINEIAKFIQGRERRPLWNRWYVGVTDNPSRRLYAEHNASSNESIVLTVESEAVARSVEKFFVERYGTAGNPGGGENPRFVYAFKMMPQTRPPWIDK
jgi:hypothetical protein